MNTEREQIRDSKYDRARYELGLDVPLTQLRDLERDMANDTEDFACKAQAVGMYLYHNNPQEYKRIYGEMTNG